jgi:hypothetical protein
MGTGLQQLPVTELDALTRLHENGLRRIRELQVRPHPVAFQALQRPLVDGGRGSSMIKALDSAWPIDHAACGDAEHIGVFW